MSKEKQNVVDKMASIAMFHGFEVDTELLAGALHRPEPDQVPTLKEMSHEDLLAGLRLAVKESIPDDTYDVDVNALDFVERARKARRAH